MLAIFAVIIGGIVTGRLLVGWRLAFVQRLITFIIWALLFLLGVEVGSDPAVVGSLATLGAAAFAIFALSVAGSVFAAWLLWRRIRGRAVSADEGGDADEAPVSAWTALKGSLVIVAFFVAGCVAGLFAPFDMTGSRMSAYVLYALMFCRRHAGRCGPRRAAARRLVADRLAGRGRGIRLLFAFEHLHRRPPGTGAGDDRPAVQRHA